MENRLYEFTMKLQKGRDADPVQPAPAVSGAYVTCYAGAPDPLVAIRRGVAAARERDFLFIDVLGNVREIPLQSWTDYIQRAWPEHHATLPAAASLPQLVIDGATFFGPFSPYAGPTPAERTSGATALD